MHLIEKEQCKVAESCKSKTRNFGSSFIVSQNYKLE